MGTFETTTQNHTMNTIFESCDDLHRVARRLGALHSAFLTTGNTHMADVLFELSGAVEEAADTIHELHYTETHARFQDAQAASWNVLRGVLAGVTIGNNNPPPPTSP